MNRLRLTIAAFAIAAFSSSCATAPDSTTQTTGPGYGESKGAAIEVCDPDGERAYLARLVCPTGEPAAFDRLGAMDPGTNYGRKISIGADCERPPRSSPTW
jgi:hypothetical protein